MELRWVERNVFVGFSRDADGEEYNEWETQKVLQFRSDPSSDWVDVPTYKESE